MKKLCLIILALAAVGGSAPAQINPAVSPQAVRSQTVITSNVAFFSNAEHQLIYTGHVRVIDPQLQLTCEQLTADFPQSGGHISRMVALTNVVMDSVDDKGETNHATSDVAVYEYKLQDGVTNEIITLSGNARAENAQIILFGEPITYNRGTGNLSAEKERMFIKQKINDPLINTNATGAKTNLPPAIDGLPISKTNLPPGTITNINRISLPTSGTTTQ